MSEPPSRQEVRYRPARGERRCGTCTAFDPATLFCAVLRSAVRANMRCDRWELMPGVFIRDFEKPPRPGPP